MLPCLLNVHRQELERIDGSWFRGRRKTLKPFNRKSEIENSLDTIFGAFLAGLPLSGGGGDNVETLPPINRVPALLLVHIDAHDTKKKGEKLASHTTSLLALQSVRRYSLSHPLHLLARHIPRIPPARRLRQQCHLLDIGDSLLPGCRCFGLRFDGFRVLRFEGGDHVDGCFDLGFDDGGAV
jgi:hypothetical protein